MALVAGHGGESDLAVLEAGAARRVDGAVARLREGDRRAARRVRLAKVARAVLLDRQGHVARVLGHHAADRVEEIRGLLLGHTAPVERARVHARLHVRGNVAVRRHVEHIPATRAEARVASLDADTVSHVLREPLWDHILLAHAALLRPTLLRRGVRVRVEATVCRTSVLVARAGHVAGVAGNHAVDRKLVVRHAVNLSIRGRVDGHGQRRRVRDSARGTLVRGHAQLRDKPAALLHRHLCRRLWAGLEVDRDVLWH